MPHPRRIVTIRQWTDSVGRRAWRFGVGAIAGASGGAIAGTLMAAPGCFPPVGQRGVVRHATRSAPSRVCVACDDESLSAPGQMPQGRVMSGSRLGVWGVLCCQEWLTSTESGRRMAQLDPPARRCGFMAG